MAILKVNETIKSTIWQRHPESSDSFDLDVRDSNDLSYIFINFGLATKPSKTIKRKKKVNRED